MKTSRIFVSLFLISLKINFGKSEEAQLVEVWCDDETLKFIGSQLKSLNAKMIMMDEKITKADSPPTPTIEQIVANTMRDVQMQVAMERITQSIKDLNSNLQEKYTQFEQQIVQIKQTLHEDLKLQMNELIEVKNLQQKTENDITSLKVIGTTLATKNSNQTDSGVPEKTVVKSVNIFIEKISELKNLQATTTQQIEKHISNEHEKLSKDITSQLKSLEIPTQKGIEGLNSTKLENYLQAIKSTTELNHKNIFLAETRLKQDFRSELQTAVPKIVDTLKSTIKTDLPNMQCGLTKRELQTEVHALKTEMLDLNRSLSGISNFFEPLYPNCVSAIEANGVSGVYRLHTPQTGFKPFEAYCLEDPNNGTAWTIIQRRQDGSVDFYRDWDTYKKGFGNADGEYWIGLEKIYAMTSKEPHELWIQLTDHENEKRQAHYSKFEIGTVKDAYYLKSVGKYNGDAGDSLGFASPGRKFTTKDADNDEDKTRNCAVRFTGAWWYNTCNWSDLNAQYNTTSNGQGVNWYKWHGYEYSLKYTHMAIRPIK